MNITAAAFVWLVSGFVFANWPFLSEKKFLFFGQGLKTMGFRLLELAVGFSLLLAIGFGLEGSIGRMQTQTWNFYAISLCIFVLMAYPGFVWRYLRRGATRRAAGGDSEAGGKQG
jgi:hypothetical protein